MSSIQYILEKNNNLINASLSQEHGGIFLKSEKDFFSFYLNFSNSSYFDSGFMPVNNSGLISIRRAGSHTQLVYQHEPSINIISWSWSEGGNAHTYKVAQPYRIVIMDFVENSFYGARNFYSPYPMSSYRSILYHTNLPNVNCGGYSNGLGVGWICIYHKSESSNLLSINEMLMSGLARTSNFEVFNDTNMPETDGVRYYQQAYANCSLDVSLFENHEEYYDVDLDIYSDQYSYLWNPKIWQQKTEKEGLDFILDETILLPVYVEGIDNQDQHYPNGVHLTLEMAIKGSYKSYYEDPSPLKLYNKIDRILNPNNDIYFGLDNSSFSPFMDDKLFADFHSSFAKSPIKNSPHHDLF